MITFLKVTLASLTLASLVTAGAYALGMVSERNADIAFRVISTGMLVAACMAFGIAVHTGQPLWAVVVMSWVVCGALWFCVETWRADLS